VKTLAERWDCSESHIRKAILAGELRAFGIGGKLVRIAAEEVARIEGGACLKTTTTTNSHLDGTGASSRSSITKMAGESAARSVRLIARPQRLCSKPSQPNIGRPRKEMAGL